MVSDHHPLSISEQRCIDLKNLCNEVFFIDFPKDWSIRQNVDLMCGKEGFHRRVKFEISCLELLSKLVSKNLGIAILPKKLADKFQLNQRALASNKQVLPPWTFSLYSSRTGSDYGAHERAFIDFFRKYYGDNKKK